MMMMAVICILLFPAMVLAFSGTAGAERTGARAAFAAGRFGQAKAGNHSKTDDDENENEEPEWRPDANIPGSPSEIPQGHDRRRPEK